MIHKKKQIDKLDLIKVQNFCAANDAVKMKKVQSTGWKEILANHIFNKD